MKPHSTIPATDKMAQILKRLYLARKARREAKKAMAKYLAEAWGETDEDGPGWRDPKAHEFGRCGLGQAGGPYDPEPILCPVCAYLRASREAGYALRAAQAWGKRFAERVDPFPPVGEDR